MHLDIDRIESVQRRMTKRVLKRKPYNERLVDLGLPTLHYRRERQDMLQVFKILQGYDDINPDEFFTQDTSHRTRGHPFKLSKPSCRTARRANTFKYRVINPWNSLPDEVVCSQSLNMFKSRINSAWKNKPSKFTT